MDDLRKKTIKDWTAWDIGFYKMRCDKRVRRVFKRSGKQKLKREIQSAIGRYEEWNI